MHMFVCAPAISAQEDVPWSSTGSQVEQHEAGASKGYVCLIIHLHGLIWFSYWHFNKPRVGNQPSNWLEWQTLQQNLCPPTAVGCPHEQDLPKCSGGSIFRLVALSHTGASEILNPLRLLREKLIVNGGNSPIWILLGFPLPCTDETVANLH